MKKFTLILFVLFSLTVFSQAPSYAWAKSGNGNYYSSSNSVATDASGNSYICGIFSGPTFVFGTYTLTNYYAGNSDVFLVKYDPSGNVLWVRSAGKKDNDQANAITIDALGNCYMTGYFRDSTITFGTYTLTNSSVNNFEMFLVKYNSSGIVQWAKSAAGGLDDTPWAIKADVIGNIYVTGWYASSSLSLGTYTINNTGGQLDIFIAKYDSNGNVLWAKSEGGSSYDNAFSIEIDVSGNFFIVGSFSSPSLTFGTTTLNNVGLNSDIYIAKYNSAGIVQWAKRAGGSSYEQAMSVITDVAGNSYVTGYFNSSSISFGTTTLTSGGNSDIFITKYDAAGNVLWAKNPAGSGYEDVYSITRDASSNVYITGTFGPSSVSFGTVTLNSSGASDIFVVKYDQNGNAIWGTSTGGSGANTAKSVTADISGNIFITGSYGASSLAFGTTTLTTIAPSDVFTAKLNSTATGINVWEKMGDEVRIFPNPTSGKLRVETSSREKMEVYNALGENVYSTAIDGSTSSLDLGFLNNGMYFIKIGNITKKIIKE